MAKIAELAKKLEPWMEWDQFDLSNRRLTYPYGAIVSIGTASDLEDFFEVIAGNDAARAWTHHGEDGEGWYYGPDEISRLDAEIAELKARELAVKAAIDTARAKLARLKAT